MDIKEWVLGSCNSWVFKQGVSYRVHNFTKWYHMVERANALFSMSTAKRLVKPACQVLILLSVSSFNSIYWIAKRSSEDKEYCTTFFETKTSWWLGSPYTTQWYSIHSFACISLHTDDCSDLFSTDQAVCTKTADVVPKKHYLLTVTSWLCYWVTLHSKWGTSLMIWRSLVTPVLLHFNLIISTLLFYSSYSN